MAPLTGLPSYLAGRSQKLVESTDVVLIVSGREFPVHSTALAVGCKFFNDLFFDSTVEAADMDSCEKPGSLESECPFLSAVNAVMTTSQTGPSDRLIIAGLFDCAD